MMSVVCLSTFTNILSETTGSFELKFHMKTPEGGGTKVGYCGSIHTEQLLLIFRTIVFHILSNNLKYIA